MHGEELSIGLVREELVPGAGEIGPDQQGQDAPDQEEPERRDHVQDSDSLVVGGREPCDGAHAATFCLSQAVNCVGVTTRTMNVMNAWFSPQNSAHSPR